MTWHLFVADPIELFDPCHDTTVAMIEAVQRRGHRAAICTVADLGLDGGGPYGWVTEVEVKPAAIEDGRWVAAVDWYTLGEPARRPLSDFAVVSMRTDPPVDRQYLHATFILDHVDPDRTVVVNRPEALRIANEKMWALHFPELMPPTIVTTRRDDIVAFVESAGAGVLKPIEGMAGRGILLLRPDDPNLPSIADSATDRGRTHVMVQGFIPEVAEGGDRRVIVVDGEPVGSVARVAGGLDFRCNMAAGGSVVADEIDGAVEEICTAMADRLRAAGLWFVGLDVIGGRLTEVNVTSPTGAREIQLLSGVDVAERYVGFTDGRTGSR